MSFLFMFFETSSMKGDPNQKSIDKTKQAWTKKKIIKKKTAEESKL